MSASPTSAEELRPPVRCDVAVVGAGIVGLAVARELLRRRPGARVVVLERESEVARHQTGHSSGVVHAGIYYRPGSLKASLCVRGAALLADFCAEQGLPFERCGKLIVARHAGELPALDELERRGLANGVPGLRRLGGAEIAEREPHAVGIAALHSPATAVTDFGAVARALADDVRRRGGELVLGCGVRALEPQGPGVAVVHDRGVLRADRAIACAGGWADRLARATGGSADPRIVPFRGQYLELAPSARPLVRALLYPVPDPALPFLGVHLTRMLSGRVLLGPSALLAGARDAYRLRRVRARDLAETLSWPGTWRMLARWPEAAAAELRLAASRAAFVARARQYVPELTAQDVRRGPSGVRAQALARDGTLLDDFLAVATAGVLHVRNAPSPAATAALALAEEIADRAGVHRPVTTP
jgi:2-hydroxyglutarate dehydrogenase